MCRIINEIWISQDRGVLHICEALIEQANYFKVLHGSSSTAMQPLSSKHTLTRGDKIDLNVRTDKESKYECLARLINSTQAHCETINLNTNSIDKQTNIEKSTIENASKCNDENNENDATVVTTFEKNDNNSNQIDESTTSTLNKDQSAEDVCELKIVEKIEQNDQSMAIKHSKSDNNDDDDVSIATSNSTISFDSSEKSSTDLDAKTNLDNNNSTIVNACRGQETQNFMQNEQNVELESQQQQQQTIKATDDLNTKSENLEQTPHLNMTTATTTTNTIATNDCHLDINENKSDMKLNYAEVVKVEKMENQLCENKNFTVTEECSDNDNVDNKIFDSNSTSDVPSDLESKVQIPDSNDDVNNTKDDNSTDKRRTIGCSSPKPIQINNINENNEQEEEMSPICKVRLPLNSPRLTKSKDLLSELPLTPDSSHSLDSSCEFSAPFEAIKQYSTPIVPVSEFIFYFIISLPFTMFLIR